MDQPDPVNPFGARRAILLFAGFVGVQFVAGLMAGIVIGVWKAISTGTGKPSTDFLLFTAMCGSVVGAIVSAIFLLLALRRMFPASGGDHRFAELGWNRGGAGTVVAAAGAGILLSGAVLGLIALVPPPESMQFGFLAKASMQGGATMYLWAFLAIVLAPPIEELMFRGVLWAGFSRTFDARIAAALTTAVFVAMHLPETGSYWPAILGITLLGAATLSARLLTRSLAPPIALHFAYNVVVCCAVIGGQQE